MPEPPSSGKKPEIAQLDEILAPPDAGNFTEATIKYEAPETRQAREALAAASAAHKQLISLMRLGFAGVLMLLLVGFGLYALFLKPNATEAQKLHASTVLTAIASGSAGYAFGKKQDKLEKE